MDQKAIQFCDLLQGKYDNWQQASSNPRLFSHVMLRWDRLSDNKLKIKQWYVHEGESKPYRERWHRVLTEPETSAIIVENWSENFEAHKASEHLGRAYDADTMPKAKDINNKSAEVMKELGV